MLQQGITFATVEERDWYEQGLFQGGFNYTFPGTIFEGKSNESEVLIASVSGRTWAIDKCDFQALEITPGGADGRGPKCNNLGYMVQAKNWLVVQDGVTRPILWDGSNSRRAADGEVPTGTIMAFGEGRIWMMSGNSLRAGDLIDNSTDAVIRFRERLTIAGGGDLFPAYVLGGGVNALAFVQQQDTNTGVGPLFAFGSNATVSIFAARKRTEWAADTLQRGALLSIGNTGHRHVAQVNGDLWIRPLDGVRAYRQARAEQGKNAQVPFSTEVEYFLNSDSESLLKYGSSAFFDNRLLVTTCPVWDNGRVYHKGMLALDMQILSSRGETTKPSWDGLWTGFNICQILTTKKECYIFTIDELGRNTIHRLTESMENLSGQDDHILNPRRIKSSLIGGAYAFDKIGGIQKQKKLTGGSIHLEDIIGELDLRVEYKADGSTCWNEWLSAKFCAPEFPCDETDTETDPCDLQDEYPDRENLAYSEQYRKNVFLPESEVTRIKGTDTPPLGGGNSVFSLSSGFEFQPRISWEGEAAISLFVMDATEGQQKGAPGCKTDEPCVGYRGCCYDEFEATPEVPETLPL